MLTVAWAVLAACTCMGLYYAARAVWLRDWDLLLAVIAIGVSVVAVGWVALATNV